ncbi:MAG: SUMF1/EgtB/PvdO family nonheme iron enzyme, partial [Tepidisphaeraceae bacterium]
MRMTCVHLVLFCLAGCFPAWAGTDPATRPTTQPATFRLRVRPSTHEVEFVRIPGGRVELAPLVEGERPHTVQVKPFYMARTETTQEVVRVWSFALDVPLEDGQRAKEFEARTGRVEPPCFVSFSGTREEKDLPAANIPPASAVAYCQWIGKQNNRVVRLPTEAEWQLAALSGRPTTQPATPAQLAEVAWFADNSDDEEHTVATLKPNAFGLYDMLGNVGEWVLLENGEYCLKGGSFRSE